MKKPIFVGSCPAIITPFCDKGVDYAALEKIVEFQIKNGSSALVVCGTTGEPSTMSKEEKQAVIRFVISKAAKRVPVIAGTGGNNTANVIEDSLFAEHAGADALLIVTPYYNKATQGGLVAHYHAVADKVGLPIVVYNVPGRTGLNILPATLAKIAEHKNIAAVKEASGNAEQAVEIASLTAGKIDLYSGDDALTLPLLSIGGKGVISVAANIIPAAMAKIVSSFFAGDIKTAQDTQLKAYPLIKTLFSEVNPIPVKTAASMMGLCNGVLRLPLTPMEEATKEKLIKEMKKFGGLIA